MTPPLVDYLIARRGLPPRSGLAYDYVVAGDGLFVSTENEHLSARVPVAACPVRGLLPVHAACVLRHGRLPVTIWNDVVDTARTWAIAGHEVLLAVVWFATKRWFPSRSRARASTAGIMRSSNTGGTKPLSTTLNASFAGSR